MRDLRRRADAPPRGLYAAELRTRRSFGGRRNGRHFRQRVGAAIWHLRRTSASLDPRSARRTERSMGFAHAPGSSRLTTRREHAVSRVQAQGRKQQKVAADDLAEREIAKTHRGAIEARVYQRSAA